MARLASPRKSISGAFYFMALENYEFWVWL
jgi:hypothetical protein